MRQPFSVVEKFGPSLFAEAKRGIKTKNKISFIIFLS
jgi:hypothetical protein